MDTTIKKHLLQERLEIIKARDGYLLRCRVWSQSRAKGSVIYLAGIESHGGWYQASASYLFSKGFNVYFLDRRGTGLNSENRGDIPSYKTLFSDLDDMLEKVLCDHPAKPIHLMALSWGGKWALGWCLDRQNDEIASLTLITPGLIRKVNPPLLKKMWIVICAWIAPSTQFAIPIHIEQYTQDPKWRQFIEHDSLRLKTLSARFLKEDFFLGEFIKRSSRQVLCRAKLFLAGQDSIINSEATRKLFVAKTGANSEIQVFPQATHTLEFEAFREEFFQNLSKWLLMTS